MDNVPNLIKIEIIKEKIQQWNNTLYEISLDERIGRITNNPILIKAASERMRGALMAIDELTELKAEIEASEPAPETTDTDTNGEET